MNYVTWSARKKLLEVLVSLELEHFQINNDNHRMN